MSDEHLESPPPAVATVAAPQAVPVAGAVGTVEPAQLLQQATPGPFTRFLWYSAGADAKLLRYCPGSDWVKFQSIGGVVLATTVLALISASYALYTVFSPKTTTALDAALHWPTVWGALVGGLIWALVIFNIDRFIVSSAGKGDGTEKITLQELVQSLPRLIMALIIGVCISAPLEIRILKPEIDAQLELEQNAYLTQLNAQSEDLLRARKTELEARLDKAQTFINERTDYFETRRLEIGNQRRALELEAEGKSGRGIPGRGPAWQDKKDTLDKLEAELTRDRAAFAEKEAVANGDVQTARAEMDRLSHALEEAKDSNQKQARHMDGLLKRIAISHQIGGMVPWAIMLLLLAVETGPIFFKMMLVKGIYDLLQENQKRLAAARLGIELDAQVFMTEQQEELRVDLYHQVNAVLAEERRKLQSLAALETAAHERLRRRLQEEDT